MDTYWIQLASQWIQNKSVEGFVPNFPNFQTIIEPTNQPAASSPNSSRDNHVATDMEIEEDEPVQTFWGKEFPNSPDRKQLPTTIYKLSASNCEPPQVAIPDAPIISQTSELTIPDVDMILDSEEENSQPESLSIEAQKRKKLPIWIRDGLERIEREKKQEALRIERENEFKQGEENRKKIMQEALIELEREKNAKSKFESESDEDDPPAKLPIQPHPDDGDAYEKMMLLVRKTLTEILLEVTDEKIHEISSETLSKYHKKGLGAYGSSDEDSEVEENVDLIEQCDWEPEHVIRERIRIKSIAYEQKAKDIKERLAKLTEVEQSRYARKEKDSSGARTKSKYGSDDETSRSRIRKVDGEEKLEQNFSVSSSFVSAAKQRDKKKSRFNDPKDPKERASNILVTHVAIMDSTKALPDIAIPNLVQESSVVEREKRNKRRDSSTTSSSNSGRHKKHKKHKKSGKHSKKNKKRDRSKSRDERKSDRRSIESRSSVRSSESRRHRSRSRSPPGRHRSRRY